MRVIVPDNPTRYTFLREHVTQRQFRTDDVLALDALEGRLQKQPAGNAVPRTDRRVQSTIRAADFFAEELPDEMAGDSADPEQASVSRRLYFPVRVKPTANDLAPHETADTEHADVTTLLADREPAHERQGVLLLSGSGTGKTVASWKVFHDCLHEPAWDRSAPARRSAAESSVATPPATRASATPPRHWGKLPCWLPLPPAVLRSKQIGAESLLEELILAAAFSAREGNPQPRRSVTVDSPQFRHWLADGLRLIVLVDLNPVEAQFRVPVATGIQRFLESHGPAGHRCVVTFRSTVQDSPEMTKLRRCCRSYDLLPLDLHQAARYVRQLRNYESWVVDRLTATGVTVTAITKRTAEEIQAEVDLLRGLIHRHVHDDSSLISTPLLMHLVTTLDLPSKPAASPGAAGSPGTQKIRTISQLYDRVVQQHLQREWSVYGVHVVNREGNPPTENQFKSNMLSAMTRLSLVLQSQAGDTRTRIDRETAEQWLRFPVEQAANFPGVFPTDGYWLGNSSNALCPYYSREFSEPGVAGLLELSLLKQDGLQLRFLHDSFIDYFAGACALARPQDPAQPLKLGKLIDGVWPEKVAARIAERTAIWVNAAEFLAGDLGTDAWEALFCRLLIADETPEYRLLLQRMLRGAEETVETARELYEYSFRATGGWSHQPNAATLYEELHYALLDSPLPAAAGLRQRLLEAGSTWNRLWLRRLVPLPRRNHQVISWHQSRVGDVSAWVNPLDETDARVVSGDDDGWICVSNLRDGTCIREQVHERGVTSLAVLPDGRIVSGSHDNTVRVWDLTKAENDPVRVTVLQGHTNWVTSVCVLPADGNQSSRIASGSRDSTVRVWDLTKRYDDPGRVTVLKGCKFAVWCVCVLPDAGNGKARIVSGSSDKSVRIWDLTKRYDDPGRVTVLKGHTDWVRSVCVLLDAARTARIVSGSLDGTMRVWDLMKADRDPDRVTVLAGHTSWVNSVCVLPDPAGTARIVSGSLDNTVRVWDLTKSKTDPDRVTVLKGHTAPVMSVCVLPVAAGTARIVSSSDDNTVRVWDLTKSKTDPARVTDLTGHTDILNSVAVLPGDATGSGRIVSGSDDKTVRVWDLTKAEHDPARVTVLTGHTASVRSVCVLPSHADRPALIVSGSSDHTVRMWDLTKTEHDPSRVRVMEGHTRIVSSVCVLSGGLNGDPRIISGSGSTTVAVWDLTKPKWHTKKFTVLEGRTGRLTCVCALLADENRPARIVSGSRDRTVRVWDLTKPENDPDRVTALEGHWDWVTSVCVLPAAAGIDRIVSGSWDKTVRVWDMSKPRRTPGWVTVLWGHTEPVTSVCILPDAAGIGRIVSGSWDNTVRVWDVETGELCRYHTNASVNAVAVDPTAPVIVAGLANGEILRLAVEPDFTRNGPFPKSVAADIK